MTFGPQGTAVSAAPGSGYSSQRGRYRPLAPPDLRAAALQPSAAITSSALLTADTFCKA
jgi:hypothetical protein